MTWPFQGVRSGFRDPLKTRLRRQGTRGTFANKHRTKLCAVTAEMLRGVPQAKRHSIVSKGLTVGFESGLILITVLDG